MKAAKHRVYRTGRIFILHRDAREVWGAVRDRRTGRIDVWLAAAADGAPELWMAPHATRDPGARRAAAP